jgi:hypothetical protein
VQLQRSAALLTDVAVSGGRCSYALGVLVECLPGASAESVELSIANLQRVATRGISRYLLEGGLAPPLRQARRAAATAAEGAAAYLIKPQVVEEEVEGSQVSHEDRLHAIVDGKHFI